MVNTIGNVRFNLQVYVLKQMVVFWIDSFTGVNI